MTEMAELDLHGGRPALLEDDWTTTTSMMQGQGPMTVYRPTELEPPGKQSFANYVIVLLSSTKIDPEDIVLPEWAKYYWWHSPVEQPPASIWYAECPLRFEATQEQLGHPGDAVTSMSAWPDLWQHAEPEPTVWRGVFSPTYRRKVLFSKPVKFRTSELPRWRPHIVISRHTLEAEDA